MRGTQEPIPTSPGVLLKATPALRALLEAQNYADDTDSNHWDFAVGIRCLRRLGLEDSDLRWLVRKGYVNHAREITRTEDERREFRSVDNLSFCKKTCFAITTSGRATAQSLVEPIRPTHAQSLVLNQIASDDVRLRQLDESHPEWNPVTRELRFGGKIVKRFKWQAINQEIVLSAFEEDEWATVIDDPLPPKAEQDTKRRLHDTIKALNRNQEHDVIRFHGNGTGEGIRWEFLLV